MVPHGNWNSNILVPGLLYELGFLITSSMVHHGHMTLSQRQVESERGKTTFSHGNVCGNHISKKGKKIDGKILAKGSLKE